MVKSPRMAAGNGVFYPIVGFATCLAFIYMSFGDLWVNYSKEPELSFVRRNGTRFTLDGGMFYINGWNSYWLMDHAADEYTRPRVREMLQAGAKMGLTVCRTWAFNDGGGYNALQISPGRYDERVFKGLDHVIAEARQQGIRLLLCIVNNLKAYGGKTQYVNWAWEEGIGLSSSNDSFFYDPSIRIYFKNHVKDWIEEMSMFVKSIDKKHLLTVGLEGFYGPKSPKKSTVNPGDWAADLGSDFIRNTQISTIDFASVHIYPDHWFHDQEFEEKLKYIKKWTVSHIEDCDAELKKPVMFTEFGLSNLNKDFEPSKRDQFYKVIYDIIYKSAKRKKSGAGSFVWQFLVGGMEEYNDDFGIIPWDRPLTYQLITKHSCKLAAVQGVLPSQKDHLKELCPRTR
ncbi:hypothetical protein RHMOL_Rhmol04G0106500 [Rhododendron molle]|uniref:Uncharacterized protein n=1 Tax=Rhododendron molle TaxID=49168 RepID=A0ACC0P052_RHOML|nr:hypothetical protein RHMOL_Rhmol04G0106500 [Rhododendron molle]